MIEFKSFGDNIYAWDETYPETFALEEVAKDYL